MSDGNITVGPILYGFLVTGTRLRIVRGFGRLFYFFMFLNSYTHVWTYSFTFNFAGSGASKIIPADTTVAKVAKSNPNAVMRLLSCPVCPLGPLTQ